MSKRTRSTYEINHVKIFDFDETLYRVPAFASREAKGLKNDEWWDSPCSLDFELNPRVIKNVHNHVNANQSFNYMITRRVPACKDAVLELLAKDNIHFDNHFFIGRENTKASILFDILKAHPTIKRITIFEDSIWEIMQYAKELNAFNPYWSMLFKTDFKFVDKTKVIDFSFETAFTLSQANTFEKIELI